MFQNPLTALTIAELKKAVILRQRIDALRAELDRLVTVAPSFIRIRRQRKRRLAGTTGIKPQRRWDQGELKRKKLSRAARARLSAMAKARWAKVKASGKNRL